MAVTIALLSSTLYLLSSCGGSKKSDPAPQPVTFDVSLLLGAKWITTAAILTKQDGSTVNPTGGNLNQLYLSDVTFLTPPSGITPGNATESDYAPPLTWTYNSTTSNLIVTFTAGSNGISSGSVNATINKLDAHTLVLHREGTSPEFGTLYAKIDQTLTR